MVLETDRMILREWHEEDAEELFRHACSPDVGSAAGWPPHSSVAESREIIRKVLSLPETYALVLKETGLPIGSISIKTGDATDFTDADNECELGYWLGKEYWGAGLMPEAVREIIRYAFEDLGMINIWCGYYDGNEKSKRVQEKCGFKYQWTTEKLEVPLLGVMKTGHANLLTKEEWRRNE